MFAIFRTSEVIKVSCPYHMIQPSFELKDISAKASDVTSSFENFSRYDWISKQSFCYSDQRQVKMSPVINFRGLCFTFNGKEDSLRREV